MSEARKFPPLWRVEQTDGGAFMVRNAYGFRFAYVYGRMEHVPRSPDDGSNS